MARGDSPLPDFSDQAVAVEPAGKPKPLYMAQSNPKGLVAPGNIDLHARPIAHNPDGSISTVLSTSFGDDKGEVLVPRVMPDGSVVSAKQAWEHYLKTGQNLGTFNSVADANHYAQVLHQQQAREYTSTHGSALPDFSGSAVSVNPPKKTPGKGVPDFSSQATPAQPPSAWGTLVHGAEDVGGGIARGAGAGAENVISAGDLLLGGLASTAGEAVNHPEWGDRFFQASDFLRHHAGQLVNGAHGTPGKMAANLTSGIVQYAQPEVGAITAGANAAANDLQTGNSLPQAEKDLALQTGIGEFAGRAPLHRGGIARKVVTGGLLGAGQPVAEHLGEHYVVGKKNVAPLPSLGEVGEGAAMFAALPALHHAADRLIHGATPERVTAPESKGPKRPEAPVDAKTRAAFNKAGFTDEQINAANTADGGLIDGTTEPATTGELDALLKGKQPRQPDEVTLPPNATREQLVKDALNATTDAEKATTAAKLAKFDAQAKQTPKTSVSDVEMAPKAQSDRATAPLPDGRMHASEGWVIRNKQTGEPVMETHDEHAIQSLNHDKYEAVPVSQHLSELNQTDSAASRHARDEQSQRPEKAESEALDSQSPIKSVQANIQRGRKAMNRALTNKADEHRAMYRPGMGWVDFVWGDSKKGLQHILERRASEGMDAPRMLVHDMVDTIANGSEIRRSQIGNNVRAVVRHGNHEAVLVRHAGSNAWLLTGFEDLPGDEARSATQSSSTHAEPIRSRSGEGAGMGESLPRPDAVSNESNDLRGRPNGEVQESDLTPDERELVARARAHAVQGHQEAEADAAEAQLGEQMRQDNAAQGDREAEQRGFKQLATRMFPGQKVIFVHDEDGIAPDVRKRLRPLKRGRVRKGFYDPATKQVFVLTRHAPNAKDVAWTLAHEVAGHKAFRAWVEHHADVKVGHRSVVDALNSATDMARQNPTVAKLADVIARQRGSTGARNAVEEALAELQAATLTKDWGRIKERYGVDVPDAMKPSVVRNIANYIKRVTRIVNAIFHEITGKPGTFTDEDVRDMLANTRDHLDDESRLNDDVQGLLDSSEPETNEAQDRSAAQWKRKLRMALEPGRPEDFTISTAAPIVLRKLGVLGKTLAVSRRRLRTIHSDHPEVPTSVFENLPTLLSDPEVIYTRGAKFGQGHQETNAVIEVKTKAGEPILVGFNDGQLKTITPRNDMHGVSGKDRLAEEIRGSRVLYARDEEALRNAQGFESPQTGTIPSELGGSRSGLSHKIRFRRDFFNYDHDEPLDISDNTSTKRDLAAIPLEPRAPGETVKAWHARIMRGARTPIRDGLKVMAGISGPSEEAKMKEVGRGLMVQMWSHIQRQTDKAQTAFAQAMKVFDRAGEKTNRAAIHQWETGQEVTSAPHRIFFRLMKDQFDRRVARIQKMAPGAMEHVIENYFPHLWEDPTKAKSWYQGQLARRPLEGNKSFLKQRVHDTMEDGIAAGLKPVSTNPVDLVLAKMAAMDKFIAFLEFRKELEGRGWLQEMEAGERVPPGYVKVDDPAFVKAAGLQGYYAVPEMIGRDINWYLAPGISGSEAFNGLPAAGFRGFRKVENTLMSSRLGWSAFHAGFTTFENLATHFNTSVQYMLNGMVGKGLETFLKTPWDAVVMAPWNGGRIAKVWRGIDPKDLGKAGNALGLTKNDANTAALLEALEAGGARWKMSGSDWNRDLPQLVRSLRQKDFGKSARKTLGAIGEASSWVIHHKLVPAQKMSARILMAKFELDRAAGALREAGYGVKPGEYAGIIEAMHPDALRQLMRRVNNRIDDRLGQMSYDNQFWNRAVKEIAQTAIGAVGWQMGTLRTVTGALADVPKLWRPEALVSTLDKEGRVTNFHTGRVGDRLTYLMTLALVMGSMSAITQYALTGELPSQPKDYFFPKTGRKNADGSDERLSFPSYWADHYKLATHPLQTIEHKIHPAFGMIVEALHNQDYFGVEIRDPHAPRSKQAEQVGEYIAEGFLPYSLTNGQKAQQNNVGVGRQLANFVGISDAPASVTRSKFQAFVGHNGNKGFGHEKRTRADAEHSHMIHRIENQIRNGGHPDLSQLNRRDLMRVERETLVQVPELEFHKMAIEDKLEAWDMATPKERREYHLRANIARSDLDTPRFRRLPVDEQDAIRTRIAQITRR